MENNNGLVEERLEPESSSTNEVSSSEQAAQETASMESLLEEQGLPDSPNQGEIRTGTIASIREAEVLVSIGTKSEGVISGRELDQVPASERAGFYVGQEIPVFVVAPEDANGNVVLSYVRAREEKDWETVESMRETGETYQSKVDGNAVRTSSGMRVQSNTGAFHFTAGFTRSTWSWPWNVAGVAG